MDNYSFSLAAHATHRFLSPVSPETLHRTLAFANLAPGARVADLGTGNGLMAAEIAEHYAAHVEAVERSPLMVAHARERLKGRGAPGRVVLHEASSVDFLNGVQPFDMICAVGAIGLASGSQEPRDVMGALAAHIRPGGSLLFGESYWKKPPSDLVRMLIGPQVSVLYKPHAGYIYAGEEAGLTPLYAVTAPDQDWDEYTWRYSTAVETWVRDNPDHEDAKPMSNRIHAWRKLYLDEGRDTMGFGLYLFRKPG